MQPQWAVALEPFARADEANLILQRIGSSDLPPGYPWGVLAEDLALQDASATGILVVLGLFADQATAQRLVAVEPRAKAFALASAEQARQLLLEHLSKQVDGHYSPQLVQVDDGAPIDAFAADDVSKWEDLRGKTSYEDRAAERRDREAATAGLARHCQATPGSLHLIETRYLVGVGQDFIPVQCPDGKVVYVPWERARRYAVVRADARGGYRIVQPDSIECDVPRYEEWVYSRTGRTPLPEGATRLVERGKGCEQGPDAPQKVHKH